MSKHVWRMHSRYDRMYGIQASEPDLTDKANCTLVPDEACFPVKEAMRLCAACAVIDESKGLGNPMVKSLFVYQQALDKYRIAVARMKAKKAGRK